MPKGRYRYDDDHPEIAIIDLFEGNVPPDSSIRLCIDWQSG